MSKIQAKGYALCHPCYLRWLWFLLQYWNGDINFEKEERDWIISWIIVIDDLKLYGSKGNEIDSLVKVIKIISGDMGTKFGFQKSVVLKMERGKKVHCEGIDLGDGKRTKEMIKGPKNSREGWYLSREDEERGAEGAIEMSQSSAKI